MSQVTEHLKERGIDFEVLQHEPTNTSLAEAHVLGVPEDQVAKTVVLDVRTGHAFAVLQADCQLDLDKVRAAINSRHVELATEDEIERDYPEFELGAIPPLGQLVHTPLIVDEKVIDHDEIIFAAGSQAESVRMKTRDLFEFTNAR
ncbi:MAG: YbaK/EbsC family protein, partial [Nitriliruptorales bacterium]|nr:YbaK/EbsC family protein [Nitriliruptorales bacterium]